MSGDDHKHDEPETLVRDAKIEQLYRFLPAVKNFMRRHGFDGQEVEDLTQMVWLRVCENVNKYRGEATWAFLEKVAKTVALNEIRRRHAIKRSALESPLDDAIGLATNDLPADERVAKEEFLRRLRSAVAALDVPLRSCMLLSIEEKSYQEIAKELNLSVAAVKSRLHTARERLRESTGVDLPETGGE